MSSVPQEPMSVPDDAGDDDAASPSRDAAAR